MVKLGRYNFFPTVNSDVSTKWKGREDRAGKTSKVGFLFFSAWALSFPSSEKLTVDGEVLKPLTSKIIPFSYEMRDVTEIRIYTINTHCQ